MRTLIVFIIFILLLGQLTARVDFFKTIYLLDLVTNLQMQLAFFSVFLSLILGFWNRSLMFILIIVNALVIIANFNGYIAVDLLPDEKYQIKESFEEQHLTVVQFTFDDEVSDSLDSIYEKLNALDKDITVLFNVTELHKTRLQTLSNGKYSYGLSKKVSLPSNIAVITKFPINSKRRNTFLDERGDILELNILFNKQTVKLLVMHPPKPKSKLNWQRKNLMINTLETMESHTENVSPYTIVIAELYTSIWSGNFPKLDNLITCSYAQGVYGNWFANHYLKIFGNFGAINTSHCFFSYRFKIENLESELVDKSLNNFVSYVLIMKEAN